MLLTLLLLLPGCAQPQEQLGKLTGKVTFQGQPVKEGVVIFSNAAKGVHMTANLNEQGTYTVEMAKGFGLPLGTYAVSVSPPIVDLPTGSAPPPVKEHPEIPLPYRDPKTSGLSVTIVDGDNTFDIDMQP
ncbi:MAG: carboxypeptidase-like regulatory domain-containing protein [Gemmataceae bacterium]